MGKRSTVRRFGLEAVTHATTIDVLVRTRAVFDSFRTVAVGRPIAGRLKPTA
jgi:hypothetical protein